MRIQKKEQGFQIEPWVTLFNFCQVRKGIKTDSYDILILFDIYLIEVRFVKYIFSTNYSINILFGQ
jgi:hypothetical protein